MYYKITYDGYWLSDRNITAIMIVDEEEYKKIQADLDDLEIFQEDNDGNYPVVYLSVDNDIEGLEINPSEFVVEELNIDSKDYEFLKKLGVNQFDPFDIFGLLSVSVEYCKFSYRGRL